MMMDIPPFPSLVASNSHKVRYSFWIRLMSAASCTGDAGNLSVSLARVILVVSAEDPLKNWVK